MTIGILLCGDFSATLQAEFGSYSSMVRKLLGSRSATVFDVRERQLPRSISACEAYVITGSSAGVYDDLPWIKDLMAFLRNARGGAKLIGICFGHQVIGIMHGASIYRGPEIREEHPIHILKKDPLFGGFEDGVSMTEDHTEGITLPEGFIHLASSTSYPNEAMKHPSQKIWGVQFHPEVSGDKGLELFRNFCTHCV